MKLICILVLCMVGLWLPTSSRADGIPTCSSHEMEYDDIALSLDLASVLSNPLDNGTQLTMYYMSLDAKTRAPVTDPARIIGSCTYVISVEPMALADYYYDLQKLGLLDRIRALKLGKPPVDYGNYRVYYEIETNAGVVLSVALGAPGYPSLVNGVLTGPNRLLYEFVLPFIPYIIVSDYVQCVARMEGIPLFPPMIYEFPLQNED